MTVTLTVVRKNHPFNWVLEVVHPEERKLPPEPNDDSFFDTFVTPGYQTQLGPYPQGALFQIAAIGCNPDVPAAPGGFTCFNARLNFSQSGLRYTVGAELNDDQSAFDDLVFTLELTPVETDTLVVEFTPTRREVTPVVAGCFNAQQHWAGRCIYTHGVLSDSIPVARTDTIGLRVRAFFSPSGVPAPGASVRIVAAPTDPIGAHQHFVNRPTGTFFLLDDRSLVDSSTAGVQGQLRLTLAGQADTVVIYRTTGVAGIEQLFAQVSLGGQTKVGQDSVAVRIRSLTSMTEGSSVHLIGSDDFHPSSVRYSGTARMVSALRALADSLQVMADSFAALPPALRPAGRFPRVLGLNDMSLPWGGLFDLGGSWHHPHKAHRMGRSADIDVRRGTDDDNLALAVFNIWQRLGGQVVNEREALNHVHLEF
jgi:hypothetical protein